MRIARHRTAVKSKIGVNTKPSCGQLGAFLRERRLSLGLTQREVGKGAGLSHSVCSEIELGRKRWLRDSQLEKLAEVLECDTAQLRALAALKKYRQPKDRVGRLVRRARESERLSRDALAMRMGVGGSAVAKLERCPSRYTHYRVARQLVHGADIAPEAVAPLVGSNCKPTDSILGRVIRDARRKKLLSGQELGNLVGVSRQQISHIERGKIGLMLRNEKLLRQIAKALDLSPDLLVSLRPERKQRCTTRPRSR
ncbi:MAG: hypothetical protein COV07_04330 [Candidatus Vogelbacteria bacterium CG10_big_fil_rev_8_21_14_0_10_45_14]|uniref:HTH cro/C1-type domain-containing protein n=1 Tax=Candidatus Vogelbacteria bacterium CG10_big_fil_rev_8_21_14_0_10_45_14 TaxID=1975042 RepID=A0A2H0RIL0_9BACT|nr:MAG: hypothetical protein COV07_04330 [Candidatus Vogelbacteria bacterium CG10_big_fil_rev_8_21_14_0_10_45_14]